MSQTTVENRQTQRILGAFPLTMMGIAAIFALRNLPITAVYGWSAITFYFFAAVLFLLPSAFVCTFLAVHFPQKGGLYNWVRLAFGKNIGFIAIWLEWINTVFAFPMMIGFIIYTLIYPFTHTLVHNRLFDFSVFILIFWGITCLNFLGIKTSTRFGSISLILGTLLPTTFIVILALVWILTGHQTQIHFSASALIPHFQFGTLAFLVVVINSFSGIQVITFHAPDTIAPEKTYPKAIGFIVVILLVMVVFGTLSIAIVMPHNSPSLIGGLIQSFQAFLQTFHLAWLTPILAFLIVFGMMSEINAWVIGPSKGMLVAAEEGLLPKLFAKKNQKGAPVTILFVQALIGSLFGMAYILMPTINSAYWLLSDLSAQFTLMMWVLVFSSGIFLYLRHQRSQQLNLKASIYITLAAIGALTCFAILLFSFVPPSIVIHHDAIFRYETFLAFGIILFTLIPILIIALSHKMISCKNEEIFP